MEREHFASVTGRALGLSAEAIKEALTRLPKEEGEEEIGGSKREQQAVKPPQKPKNALETRRNLLIAAIHAYPETALAKRIEAEYSRITEAPPPSGDLPESALFEAEQVFGESPKESAADELLAAFEEAVIREAYQEGVTELRRAESTKDKSKIESAQEKCARLSSRLSSLRK
jgi:hypothetical protein